VSFGSFKREKNRETLRNDTAVRLRQNIGEKNAQQKNNTIYYEIILPNKKKARRRNKKINIKYVVELYPQECTVKIPFIFNRS
jgi:hypothetical protein